MTGIVSNILVLVVITLLGYVTVAIPYSLNPEERTSKRK